MNRDEKQAVRQARWSQPIQPDVTPPTPEHERDQALASLLGTPGWEAACSVLQDELKHQRLDFTDAQWAGRMAYQQGRTDCALDLMKRVQKASARVAALQTKGVS